MSPCCSALFDLLCSAVWPQLAGTQSAPYARSSWFPALPGCVVHLRFSDVTRVVRGALLHQVVAVEGSQCSGCSSQWRQKTIPSPSHLAASRDESSPPWLAGCEIWVWASVWGGCEAFRVCEDDDGGDSFTGVLLEGSVLGCKRVICSTCVSLSSPQTCHVSLC